MDLKDKNHEHVFWGSILIVIALAINLLHDLFTFVILVIGAYFVISGIIRIQDSKNSKTKKGGRKK